MNLDKCHLVVEINSRWPKKKKKALMLEEERTIITQTKMQSSFEIRSHTRHMFVDLEEDGSIEKATTIQQLINSEDYMDIENVINLQYWLLFTW